jgi:hypothetical protein
MSVCIKRTSHRTCLTRKGRPRPDPGCSATDDDDDDALKYL